MGGVNVLWPDRQASPGCPALDEPLEAVTIRNHVLTVAQRLEDGLGDEQWSFIDKCPAEVATLPIPQGPLTVGIDGGYVKAQGEQGSCEVIAGKSLLALHRGEEAQEPVSSKCFAFVQTYDQKPKRRLFEVLQFQGHQLNQQITFLSDGGDTVRDLQLYLNPQAEHLLDWFHVTMRLTVMQQTAKSLPETTRDEEMTYEVRAPGHQGIGTPQMVSLARQCLPGLAGHPVCRGRP